MSEPVSQTTPAVIIESPNSERLMRAALFRLSRPIPSTKGMDPKARAQRLHAELERRIAEAKEAMAHAG